MFLVLQEEYLHRYYDIMEYFPPLSNAQLCSGLYVLKRVILYKVAFFARVKYSVVFCPIIFISHHC